MGFTKVFKPIVWFLRKSGIRLIVYLGDILIMSGTKEVRRTSLFIGLRPPHKQVGPTKGVDGLNRIEIRRRIY